jgi:hypothetical protein
MTPADADLTGVRLKLERAREHIEAIRARCQAFTDREPPPFSSRIEQNSAPEGAVEYRVYAVVREQPPPDLAPMIGDAVHNIRSALDYLAYELAPPNVRSKGTTQFPICDTEQKFKSSAYRIEGITGNERELIERLQPFRSVNPRTAPLAVLNRLSNRDKHRLLVPVVAGVNLRDVWVGSDNADVRFTHLELGTVEHDALIVGFTARPKDSSQELVINPSRPTLQITLDPRDTGWTDRSLDDVLSVLHHYVERTVIDAWFRYGFLPP